jgi:hypothetical protein
MIDVTVAHPDYLAIIMDTIAARDCYSGERAVKAKGIEYLPRLSGQTNEEYAAYKTRATFYSIVGRTATALTGLAVAGDPQVQASPEMRKLMYENQFGLEFSELRYKSMIELQLTGRFGVLVDAPQGSRTVGCIPYVSESVINWRLDSVGRPTMVMLLESTTIQDEANRYKLTEEIRYRELAIVDGVYIQRLYNNKSELLEVITPTFVGKSLDYIPFVMVTPFGLGFNIEKTPLLDLVNLNLSHYRTSADLEHGRHFCGLPTPVITGSEVAGNKLKIGGNKAWVLPEQGADAFYLEFTGQGLQSLEKALAEKEAQLASLSVNVLDRSTRGSESPTTVRMRYSSETASLSLVVNSVETMMRMVYRIESDLMQLSGDFSLQFSREFISGSLAPAELKHYSEMYLAGSLSVETYVSLLRRGGTLPADRTDEAEQSALKLLADERASAAVKSQVTPPVPT